MNITSYTVEKMEDPFGILSGERYEFFLDIEVPEDDELFMENGIVLRVIYSIDNGQEKIVNYSLHEADSEKYIDLALEDDELEMVAAFCQQHIHEA